MSQRPSFPAVVVLPEPWRPSSITTRGDFCVWRQPALRIAEEREHLVAHDADDVLRRREAAEHFLVHRAIAHAIGKRLDDLEVDVRFEQRQADFPQRRLDVGLRQASVATN